MSKLKELFDVFLEEAKKVGIYSQTRFQSGLGFMQDIISDYEHNKINFTETDDFTDFQVFFQDNFSEDSTNAGADLEDKTMWFEFDGVPKKNATMAKLRKEFKIALKKAKIKYPKLVEKIKGWKVKFILY